MTNKEDKNNQKVLDPRCGSKMMRFDKNNKEVVYGDIRKEEHTLCDGRKLQINPDVVMDFRKMPFDDEQFYLVVFDPPHLNKLGKNSRMAKKYGVLSENRESDIKQGFDECMRVLKKNGTLIFKRNENQIPIRKLLKVINREPLFGHTTMHGLTMWMTFLK